MYSFARGAAQPGSGAQHGERISALQLGCGYVTHRPRQCDQLKAIKSVQKRGEFAIEPSIEAPPPPSGSCLAGFGGRRMALVPFDKLRTKQGYDGHRDEVGSE